MSFQIREIFTAFRLRRSTQTLVILVSPCVSVGFLLDPVLVLRHVVEGNGVLSRLCDVDLDDWRDELQEKAWHVQQPRERGLQEIDNQPFDMRPIVGPELRLSGGHLFLGLRREGRVLDQTVHEDEHVVSDLEWLDCGVLVFLLDQSTDFLHDLISDVGHMGTTRGRGDGVDEGDLIEGIVRDCERDLPAAFGLRVIKLLVDDGRLLLQIHILSVVGSLGVQRLDVHFHIGFEVLDLQRDTIQRDTNAFHRAGNIIDTTS
ncbi:hypothetical protein WICPIJ_007138 [Wickerhamomyces pijperi]|uniref:Uncharacterized protein n=1 Tax=Wickerhamomyces pijperi TaxID=599730 RepID=A0A9P8TKQ2_WICPI|nr:hypothetical protein WICPIJ_007138 [Wickerhamomyces pijperi]